MVGVVQSRPRPAPRRPDGRRHPVQGCAPPVRTDFRLSQDFTGPTGRGQKRVAERQIDPLPERSRQRNQGKGLGDVA